MNGSYIMGYSSKDKKPFEELELIPDAEMEVNQFLDNPENKKYKNIVEKTKSFLAGFYSSFALELISTVDFIVLEKNANTVEKIIKELESWNDRKKTLFTNQKYILIALNNLNSHLN